MSMKFKDTINGSVSGNAGTATKLESARTINGTSFDGSANITTANWGTARNIYIADSSAANTGTAISVNGSGNVTLKLPATIAATLNGKATSAGSADQATKLSTARNIQIGNKTNSFNGTGNIFYTIDDIGAAKGQFKTATTAATAQWYRIAQTESGINRVAGLFFIENTISGKHSITTLSVGVNYGINPYVQQLSHSAYSTTGISKARIVYHTSWSGNYAYLEVYQAAATAATMNVRLLEGVGWTLMAPNTVGSIPSGYTNKEISLVNNSIVSNVKGSLSGNASTATKLQTKRTITIGNQGVEFDGSENISFDLGTIGAATSGHNHDSTYSKTNHTHNYAGSSSAGGVATSAAKLATPVTLTIGAKGKTFDGSANQSWSLSEIGAAASSHTHTVVNKTMITTPIYNPSSGVLIDFNLNVKSGVMAIIKLSGNSYSANPPIEAIYQFYDYASGDIKQCTGSAISGPPITLKVYKADGKLKAWFQQPNNYCTFKLEVAYGNNSSTPNITLTNAAEPTANITQTVIITPNRVYSAAYKPTPADIGAANSSHGTHVTWATAVPKENGTAAIGSVNRVAREDHVHPLQTTISGNAATSSKWQNAITLQIGNSSQSLDGSKNVSYTLAQIGAAAASHGQHSVYGTCDTAAATAEKAVTISGSGFSLAAGQMIAIKFTNSNSASSVKLNVNSTGAKPIWYNTGEYTGNSKDVCGYANRVTTYMYNGSHWVWVSNGTDNNSTYSPMSLGFGYGTCNTAEATTAKVATLASYGLVKNGIVSIKFSYAVPASSTLNINSKGAKAIYFRNTAITANVIKAGDTATFIYDGSYYQLLSVDRWHNDIVNHTHNYAGSSSAGGSANSAVKLATERTLTIGNKGKTFDGTAGVSWSLAEIGASPLQKSIVSKTVSNGTLTLSTDRYQYATLANGNTIALPSVSNFTEINLFVKDCDISTIKLPDNCKWRVDPNLDSGTSFMFKFIYTTQEWLAEVNIYS